MLAAYKTMYTIRIDDKVVKHITSDLCLKEFQSVSEININWDNIEQYIAQLHSLCRYAYIARTRKGLKLRICTDIFDDYIITKKQWKHKLNINIHSIDVPHNVSLNDILKYENSDNAIQYLKERGLAICPINNKTN